MSDAELKDMLLSIQNSIINLHNELIGTKESLYNDLHSEIVETTESLYNDLHSEIVETREILYNDLHSEIVETRETLSQEINSVKQSVKKIELSIENEIKPQIGVLFDGRMDEIRHRKENIETSARVDALEMRVDNLERAIRAS